MSLLQLQRIARRRHHHHRHHDVAAQSQNDSQVSDHLLYLVPSNLGLTVTVRTQQVIPAVGGAGTGVPNLHRTVSASGSIGGRSRQIHRGFYEGGFGWRRSRFGCVSNTVQHQLCHDPPY
jgi:hypothetical protein